LARWLGAKNAVEFKSELYFVMKKEQLNCSFFNLQIFAVLAKMCEHMV